MLGLALVLGTPSSASASTEQPPVLSLSLDGQHWAAQLDQPLFTVERRWVPGHSQTVSVWVRNLAPTEAALDLRLEPDGASWSAADLDLYARVDGQPVSVGRGTEPRHLNPIGGPTRVDLTVTMSRRAGDQAQQRRTPFSVQLRLDELAATGAGSASIAGHGVLPGSSEPVGGHLPGTGTPPFGVPLTLLGLAAAARAAIVARRSHQTRKVVLCAHP